MLLFLIFGASLLMQVLAKPYIANQSQPDIVRYNFDTDHLPNYYKYEYELYAITGCLAGAHGTVNNINAIAKYTQISLDMKDKSPMSYATSDGASRSEEGALLNPGTKDEALDVNGAVRWYNSKGQLYEMTYKAGKRGYRTIIRKVRS